MKKTSKSLFIHATTCATLSASLLLTACSDSSKNANSTVEVAEQNAKITSEFVSQASDSSAHWLTPQLILLPKSDHKVLYQLLNTSNAAFDATTLLEITMPASVAQKFPHLADFNAYKVDLTVEQAKAWLKQQLLVVGLDKNQRAQKVSFVQTGAVIDALYTQRENDADEIADLGATVNEKGVQFKLWSPTAQRVELLLFNEDLTPASTPRLSMIEDTHTGVWSANGDSSLNGAYYQYQITVFHPESKKIETIITTDPYSLSLSVNSQYSQVVDLNDSATQPAGWQTHAVPTVKNVEDNIFYETHIRDFSADDNALSNDAVRGKYKAFSEQDSNGIKHLKALQKVGLNNIHLLPTYDLASINEDASQSIDINDSIAQTQTKVCQQAPEMHICSKEFSQEFNQANSLKSVLASFDINGEHAQQIVNELRQFDNFNWGYDPYHYTVPEGSYAINPQGKARLVEFREMVQNLHELGFRVIMDVVYNHTFQFGLEEKSVLDKIVPGYYHRLNTITGEVEQSTCYTCGNTATERVMMAKLMTDSLVVWARDYKIDGFRFDLMGHQTKVAMLTAREAVRAIDADTYFYGEGWNFGEVANNSRFEQASQLNLGGSEIGTFSDRLRDAVRGGGNNTRDSQGIGNGLLTQPNEKQIVEQAQQDYNARMDQLRVGLAGNLSTFPLYQANGKQVFGRDIPYGDQPTGYALDPADTINYVSKHDNQTLWDNSQYRMPFNVSTDDRVRMHLQSLSFTLFAQGIPFLHMGSEFLRSKSFLRDSYDYGDWFNRVDFSKQNNYYHVGLPPADKDEDNWPLIKEVLKGHQGRDQVQAKHIAFSSKVFEEMLAIRMSSPLFRLTTGSDIINKVSFLNVDNKQLGLLVMKIDDSQGRIVDEDIDGMVVLFNTATKAQHFTFEGASNYQLHPIQQASADNIVRQAKTDNKGFSVPALSSVVFVKVY